MEDRKRVNAQPARKFFVRMLVRDVELVPAVNDLVDNSIDGARRLRPESDRPDRYDGLWVRLTVDRERFVIEDNCGGIEVDDARRYAFKFGRLDEEEDPIGEVGQFGVGMKRTLFKLGRHFTVVSTSQTSSFSLPLGTGVRHATRAPRRARVRPQPAVAGCSSRLLVRSRALIVSRHVPRPCRGTQTNKVSLRRRSTVTLMQAAVSAALIVGEAAEPAKDPPPVSIGGHLRARAKPPM